MKASSRRLRRGRPRLEQLEVRRLLVGDYVYYDYLDDSGQMRGGRVPLKELAYSNPGKPDDSDDDTVGILGDPPPPEWTTIIDNGPTSNRVDITLIGDGYTEVDLPAYADQVQQVVSEFFDEAPFDAYLPFFNVHRVDLISNESGVDNDPSQGIERDTALDMYYYCANIERLLCINTFKAREYANYAPESDQILALANSTKYGGAGYSGVGTLAGNNSAAVEIALHEFGHSFANLADEYTYGGPTVYSGPEPSDANVSIYDSTEMANRQAKWHRWLDHPEVGTFEGGSYSEEGIYRPTQNSKMRNLNRPWGPVNTEQLIFSIYETVSPMDSGTPVGTYPSDVVLDIQVVEPNSHSLDVVWRLDGEVIPQVTGTTLDVSTLGLADGTYQIEVVVQDPTPLVRDEAMREQIMTASRQWTIQAVGLAPGPRVVGTSVVEGEQLTTNGSLSLSFQFDSPLDEADLDTSDVLLVGATSGDHQVAGFSYSSATNRLDISYQDLPTDVYSLSLVSGVDALNDLLNVPLNGEPVPVSTVPSGDGDVGGDFAVSFRLTVLDTTPPRVVDVLLNADRVDPPDLLKGPSPSNWQMQRSQIDSLTLRFSEPVRATTQQIRLTNLGIDAPAVEDRAIPISGFAFTTTDELFIDLSQTELTEGVYRLEVLDTITDAAGNRLDGDLNTVPGGTFVYEGDSQNRFFVLASSWSDDSTITIRDFLVFAYWYGEMVPTAPAYVDLTGDGQVSIRDFLGFAANYLVGVTYPVGNPPPIAARTLERRPAETESVADLAVVVGEEPEDLAWVRGSVKGPSQAEIELLVAFDSDAEDRDLLEL